MKRFSILALALSLSGAAHAQETYPARPINLVVPFAPGGASDVIARLVADEMGRILGQRIVNENIAGAGGAIAMLKAARAAPDGYTLVIGNTGTTASVYWTSESTLQFSPDSFAPIGLAAKTVPVIALRKNFPDKTPAAFLDFARKNPGKVSLGHAGIGSSNYLICLSFVKAANIEANLVSYRGGAPALNDMLGGHIDGVCDAATSAAPSIIAGEAHGLVVSASRRLAQLPDVPTGAEAGVPAFQAEGWNALFAPKGTPEPVIARLNTALREAVGSDALQKRFADLATLPASGEEFTPAYVAALVPREVEKYRVLLGK
jgi:tripartite-type tricarboxylate transporter receptor subunit TctC